MRRGQALHSPPGLNDEDCDWLPPAVIKEKHPSENGLCTRNQGCREGWGSAVDSPPRISEFAIREPGAETQLSFSLACTLQMSSFFLLISIAYFQKRWIVSAECSSEALPSHVRRFHIRVGRTFLCPRGAGGPSWLDL